MSEKPQSSPQPEIYEPAENLLSEVGVTLNPDEKAAFRVPNDPAIKPRVFQFKDGEVKDGKIVTNVIVGSISGTLHDCSFISIIETKFGSVPVEEAEREYGLVITPKLGENSTLFLKLEKGQIWGIGRSFEGQDDLVSSVSRDHCAIGLDEDNRIYIENHNPTNTTTVRTVGDWRTVKRDV
jgi:hypothetical protein